MTTLPLFDSVYPEAPGWKARATSQAAAEAIRPRAGILRDKVLALFRDGCRFTADQAAAALGADVLSVRPRVAELAAKHLIADSGIRRINSRSGKRAIVWERSRPFRMCDECGIYPADDPSPLCPGCEAYQAHTS